MLYIIGFTLTNQTYTAAVAFLTRETIQWYDKVLESFLNLMDPHRKLAIKVVITDREKGLMNALTAHLPDAYNLNCLWHLGENIKANCKRSFDHEEDLVDALSNFRLRWLASVAAAPMEEIMQSQMELMERECDHPNHEPAITYLRGLLTIKEHFVSAFTDQYQHLGQRGNSRLEGNHRNLKESLASTNSDLYTVVDALKVYFDQQWSKIKEKVGKERLRITHGTSKVFDRVSAKLQSDLIGLGQRPSLSTRHEAC